MPRSRLLVKEEMRVLGAIQIMTGLMHNNLGIIWLYLFLTQALAFQHGYIPLTLLSGYPFWSSLSFIFSGTFAVVVEKKRSNFLMSYAIGMNVLSACISLFGIFVLVFELSLFGTFSHNSLWTRAAQIMIGLIHSALGHIWTVLYVGQSPSFAKKYRPFVLLSGYPYWSFLIYVISGTFAVQAQKEQSLLLMKRTLVWTINSFGVALFGLLMIVIEITSWLVANAEMQWPQRSGMMLSIYLWIFGVLEMFLANTLVKMLNEAFYRNIYGV